MSTPFQQSERAVGVTQDGLWVFDRSNSHLHPEAEPYLADALAVITLGEREFAVECLDFQRPIGWAHCVATAPGDQIVYAVRKGRAGHTRFVLGRQPEPSRLLTVILRRGPESAPGTATLVSAFVGGTTAREPFDPRATDDDRAFWATHALIWDEQSVLPETICTTPPA